jgi:hypothetical protein
MASFRCIPSIVLGGVLLLSSLGCASSSTSNTARTSTEQLLVANAVDQALDKVNFASFGGHRVFLQDKYLDCVDKNYVLASTRHRLFTSGAAIVDAADKADVVLEIRSGVVGTSTSGSFIGTPEIALPGMLTIPEIHLTERKRQEATVKLGLVAFDPKTNELLGEGGISLARSNDNNWFVAGIGPYKNGSIKKEVTRGTTGSAAKSQPPIPPTVAFNLPASASTRDDSQMATDEAPPAKISPASLLKEENEPEWARGGN